MEIHLQTSSDGNISYSSVTFVPGIEDGGQYLTCRAENPELPASIMEDTLKLDVQCEFNSNAKSVISLFDFLFNQICAVYCFFAEMIRKFYANSAKPFISRAYKNLEH